MMRSVFSPMQDQIPMWVKVVATVALTVWVLLMAIVMGLIVWLYF